MAKMRMMLLVIIFVVVALCTITECVMSTEFQVGDEKGWRIPNARREDREFYNEWAAKHRFKVNDTVRFKYEDDSVLVVTTEEEYHKCKASHPIFFSNNEDTLFRLNRSGLFYFISGVAGHCERGQKMIIKVLDLEQQSPPPDDSRTSTTITSTPPSSSSDDPSSTITASLSLFVLVVALPFLGYQ